MKSIIIAFASTRPECLKEYLPGSSYVSFQDLLFTEHILQAFREVEPEYMVMFDVNYIPEHTKDGIIQYLAERDEAGDPLVFALVFRSPEYAVTQGLPKEGEDVNMGMDDAP